MFSSMHPPSRLSCAFAGNNLSGNASTSVSFQNAYRSPFLYTYQSIQLNEMPAESKTEEMWLSWILRKAIICFSYIMVLIFFPISVWFSLKRIRALERLVIFRLGKLQPVVGPGFLMVLPFVDHCNRVDLRSKSYMLPTQLLITSDGAIIEVDAEVKYCVSHVVNYVTRLQSQERSVEDLIVYFLVNLLSQKEQVDIEKHREMITSHAKIELNNTIINWGLEVIEVVISMVKIVKEAESTNPLNSVLMALKAANFGIEKNPVLNVLSSTEHVKALKHKNEDFLLANVKRIVEKSSNNISLSDVCAVYEFRILGDNARSIFLSCNKGALKVCEEESAHLKPDVVISLNLSVMEDLLSLKLSPIQAYVEGKLQIVSGDMKFVKAFNDVFSKSF